MFLKSNCNAFKIHVLYNILFCILSLNKTISSKWQRQKSIMIQCAVLWLMRSVWVYVSYLKFIKTLPVMLFHAILNKVFNKLSSTKFIYISPMNSQGHTGNLLRSADKVGRPFWFCSVFSFFYYYSFLFFSTATCVSRFLRDFSTNLHEIWHVDSPWWDEQTEYFFKSIGPGVGIRRGPKVLLCFIIGKTLYTVRRDKNFT